MGLSKKKITVKGKKGTYQRTVMVRSDAAKKSVRRSAAPQMTAGQVLKKHGLGIAGRGVATGIGSSVGAMAGHAAGRKIGSKSGNTYAGGEIGSHVGAFLGGRVAGQAAYRGAKGQKILRDVQGGTFGAKAMAFGIHTVTGLATHAAGAHAYNRARGYR